MTPTQSYSAWELRRPCLPDFNKTSICFSLITFAARQARTPALPVCATGQRYEGLLLQILIEPFNRHLDRLLALLAVNAVVRDVRDGDVFLLRSGHPVVSEFRVILVVEEFFLFGDDEKDGAVFDLGGIFDGSEMEQLVADRRADQIADHFGARFGIAQLAARPPGGLVVSGLGLLGVGHHPPRIECADLADDG